MKFKIETDDPRQALVYLKAPDLLSAWRELTEGQLRRMANKEEHDFQTAQEAVEGIWDLVWAALEDYGIRLEELD